ncbi:unnamed protein product [Darwinula stevensoni]|uniref:TATA element modulatory factor 1 TATA binding domain-containing protein n=1 Tax=Darwinula stevensoni TaxID=69355 RepID=A0A7R8XBR9_9CRUS|nr:unnamed protein product [Darwinula stevensoni]CAG0892666.1 unnamed protein product [Darwinula stevensoni]
MGPSSTAGESRLPRRPPFPARALPRSHPSPLVPFLARALPCWKGMSRFIPWSFHLVIEAFSSENSLSKKSERKRKARASRANLVEFLEWHAQEAFSIGCDQSPSGLGLPQCSCYSMSWLQASGIASFAKNALKEAQKTLDKALDITEDDEQENSTEDGVDEQENHKEDIPVTESETENFFTSFGLADKNKASNRLTASSIWGSFAGSFFETPAIPEEKPKHDDLRKNPEAVINAEPKTSQSDVELESGSEVTVGSSAWATASDRGSLTNSGNGNLIVSGSGSLTVSGSESVHSCPSSHTVVDDGFIHCSLNDESENEEENEDDRATPENLPEDHSLASSDERSYDFPKVESGHTSPGPMSGDDGETGTGTSSDIEVISSPSLDLGNGTHSTTALLSPTPMRVSSVPAKRSSCGKPIQSGHRRQASDTSSVNSEPQFGDMERLRRKAQELEVKEAKWKSLHSQWKSDMEEMQSKRDETERLLEQAVLEKKHIMETYQETQKNVQNLRAKLSEKETVVTQLRADTDKLSKEQQNLSGVIKKLRLKEKQTDGLLTAEKEKTARLKSDMEDLQARLKAKEEGESEHVDVLRHLSGSVQRLEKELAERESELEYAKDRAESLNHALEQAYKENSDLRREMSKKDAEVMQASYSSEARWQQSLEEEKKKEMMEKEALKTQIEELRRNLQLTQEEAQLREESWRKEVHDLNLRLEESESRVQILTQDLGAATRPLLKQIETLQTQLSSSTAGWDQIEKSLQDDLKESQHRMQMALEKQRSSDQRYMEISAQLSQLELQVRMEETEKQKLGAQVKSLSQQLEFFKSKHEKEKEEWEDSREKLSEELAGLSSANRTLEHLLQVERAALEAEKRRSSSLLRTQEGMKEDTGNQPPSPTETLRSSPTPSLARLSSICSSDHPWPSSVVEDFDVIHGSSTMWEMLQAQLKLKDGELQELERARRAYEGMRDAMSQEIVGLSSENEALKMDRERLQHLTTLYQDIQEKYNALLQMYGEKVEENEELRLDLQDVKEMYKSQIEQLVNGKGAKK